jgi:hypothetical protein
MLKNAETIKNDFSKSLALLLRAAPPSAHRPPPSPTSPSRLTFASTTRMGTRPGIIGTALNDRNALGPT